MLPQDLARCEETEETIREKHASIIDLLPDLEGKEDREARERIRKEKWDHWDRERMSNLEKEAKEIQNKRRLIEWNASSRPADLADCERQLRALRTDQNRWRVSKIVAMQESQNPLDAYGFHPFQFAGLPSHSEFANLSEEEKKRAFDQLESLHTEKADNLDTRIAQLSAEIRADEEVQSLGLDDEEFVEVSALPLEKRAEWIRSYDKKLESMEPFERLKL